MMAFSCPDITRITLFPYFGRHGNRGSISAYLISLGTVFPPCIKVYGIKIIDHHVEVNLEEWARYQIDCDVENARMGKKANIIYGFQTYAII